MNKYRTIRKVTLGWLVENGLKQVHIIKRSYGFLALTTGRGGGSVVLSTRSFLKCCRLAK